MSLLDYDGLKQEVIDWTHREDIAQRVETFIQIAETEMFNNDIQILKVRGQETTLDTVTAGDTLALPSDYQSLREIRLLIDNDRGRLLTRAPSQMRRDPGTGKPTQFSIKDTIEFNRTPDQNYPIRLVYYKIPAPLSDTNQTNEVLAENANIYLFGAVAAAFMFAVEEQSAAQYYQLFINAIKGTNKSIKQGRYGPAPQMTMNTTTP